MLKDNNDWCYYCNTVSSFHKSKGICQNCYNDEMSRQLCVAKASSLHIFEINKISEKIYLGDYEGALRKDILIELGITNILVCGTLLAEGYVNDFKYMTIEIEDIDEQDIIQYFDLTNKFIEGSNKVYIHCRAGISRSPTVTIAYLMWKNTIPFYKAFELVKTNRDVYPNKGFVTQLLEYQKLLKIDNSNEHEFSSFKEKYLWYFKRELIDDEEIRFD